jgi:alpha-D-xyloside xylohydrolase
MGDAILRDKKISIGNGAEYTNIFPFHAHARSSGTLESFLLVAERVFLLTRVRFPGPAASCEQRLWSGDVYGSYWGLRHQVAAGLNYRAFRISLFGQPISAGIGRPHDRPVEDPKFQELYATLVRVTESSARFFARIWSPPAE